MNEASPATGDLRAAGHRPRRLRDRLSGPTGTIFATTAVGVLVRIVSSMTLTRLLAPDAFGLVSIVNSIFFAITMLTDIGIQSHIIRHPLGDDARFRDAMWTIHFWRNLALCAVALAAAPLAAELLQKPQLLWPLAAASSTFFINGLSSTTYFTELRAGRASRLSLVDLALVIFQTLVCIALAVWLRSVWAIIIAMILQSLLRTIVSYVIFEDPRRRFVHDRAHALELRDFARIVLMSSTLTLIISQADKFALARLMSLHDFGLYGLAVNLAAIALTFVNVYVSRVLYPAYAKCWNEDRDRLPRLFYGSKRAASRLYALACGGLLGGSGLVVMILYDNRYLAVAPYLSMLSFAALLRLPNVSITEMMTATGRVETTLRANAARLLWLVPAGIAGYLGWGPIGLVAAVGLIELPPYLYGLGVLARSHMLVVREEATYLAIALGGAIIGFATYEAVLASGLRL